MTIFSRVCTSYPESHLVLRVQKWQKIPDKFSLQISEGNQDILITHNNIFKRFIRTSLKYRPFGMNDLISLWAQETPSGKGSFIQAVFYTQVQTGFRNRFDVWWMGGRRNARSYFSHFIGFFLDFPHIRTDLIFDGWEKVGIKIICYRFTIISDNSSDHRLVLRGAKPW